MRRAYGLVVQQDRMDSGGTWVAWCILSWGDEVQAVECPGAVDFCPCPEQRLTAYRSWSGGLTMAQSSVAALWRLRHTWGQRMKLPTRGVVGRPPATVPCS